MAALGLPSNEVAVVLQEQKQNCGVEEENDQQMS
jgi:hypothetical protein